MLSNTCKYAIRAVIYLAVNNQENKKIGIKKISKDLDIPSPFLGKILQSLAKQKLLLSTKGPNGGFSLGADANKITLYDIIEVIDGDDLFKNCLISMRKCDHSNGYCSLHSKYATLRNELKEMFKSQSLIDFAENYKNNKSKIVI